jgi:hypothetical protein
MANIYEFEVSRGVVEELVRDIGITLPSNAKGTIVDNLMSISNQPNTFQKAYIDGKPGYCIHVGRIQTERFEGQGLHIFNHSGSEGYLDLLAFDGKLKASLERQRIVYRDRT